jgi:hypothetical protein
LILQREAPVGLLSLGFYSKLSPVSGERRTGKREQAEEHLATATSIYRDMGMTHWLEKAEAEMRKPGG